MIKNLENRKNDFSSLIWAAVSIILVITYTVIYEFSAVFTSILIVLFLVNCVVNIVRTLPGLRLRRLADIVSWAILQSALLLLSSFAGRFPEENHKAFWLGIGAVLILYATARLSSAWLYKMFRDIEKKNS